MDSRSWRNGGAYPGYSAFCHSYTAAKKMQKLVDRVNLVMREALNGMMVIRAFNNQKFEEDKFDRANKDLTRTNLFVSRLMTIMMPTMMLIMNGIMLLIIWVGAHQIEEGTIQVGRHDGPYSVYHADYYVLPL